MFSRPAAPARAPEALRLIFRGRLTAVALACALVTCLVGIVALTGSRDPLVLAAFAALILLAIGGGLTLARIISDLAAREDAASLMAGHDLLSGLANRRLFAEWLDYEFARHRRERTKFALMYVDIDYFKSINDRYGHDVGDKMISAVSRRIADMLRPTDRFGRLGGDEFALLQVGVRDMRDAEALASRIVASLREPFRFGGVELPVSVSIGIALCPDNAAERDELMHLADLALYRAKREGRDRFAFFDARMSEEMERRAAFEQELTGAIAEDELTIAYAPVVAAADRRLVGYEARLRWPHPRRGLIESDEIFSIADNRGLGVALGDWMLRRIFRDAAAWPEQRLILDLTPGWFRRRDFVTHLRRALQEGALDPARLELHIPESCVLEQAEDAMNAMKSLRADGVRFAVADFGRGVASLDHLRTFPFSKVEIARACVEEGQIGATAGVLLHANIQLARNLGLVVGVDGVETDEQARLVTALGAHEFLGRVAGRPLEAPAAAASWETEKTG